MCDVYVVTEESEERWRERRQQPESEEEGDGSSREMETTSCAEGKRNYHLPLQTCNAGHDFPKPFHGKCFGRKSSSSS